MQQITVTSINIVDSIPNVGVSDKRKLPQGTYFALCSGHSVTVRVYEINGVYLDQTEGTRIYFMETAIKGTDLGLVKVDSQGKAIVILV